ncbi:MAG TPA: ABC transporter permease subunit [Roseococcus sp.]|jgi:NitT/TauT family transport system permease protein|nr:ABC transporter permease subunit [Roseococcus sp.]
MAHLLALFLVAASWEGAARAGWVATLMFPPPTTILGWLLESLRGGEMAEALLASGQRLAIGFGLGAGLGTVVGLAMGLAPRLHRAFDPVIAALHPLPKVALLPLFLVLFGFSEQARLVPVVLVAFFPAAIAAAVAVRGIDPLLWNVARNYGAPPLMVLRRLVLPGAWPVLRAGLRLSLNAAIVVLISVEMLSGNDGLGAAVWQSWQTMRVEQLYGTLLVLAVLGLLFNRCLGR